MQQVGQVEGGERDYSRIRGDTGPLVYGAGHVLFFWLLKLLTGGRVLLGQLCFALVYLATQAMMLGIYVYRRDCENARVRDCARFAASESLALPTSPEQQSQPVPPPQ